VTKHDAVFLKHFAQLIVGLMVFTLLLIIVAHAINHNFYGYGEATPDANIEDLNSIQRERVAAQRAAAEARLQPVGSVQAGETGLAAIAAAETARQQALASQVAYGGTLDGAVIYQNLCGACHQNGAAGAPAPTRDAWAPRIAQGLDTLVKHAIEGYQGPGGVMSARGGNPALTDEQVRATVEYMVAKYAK
jgi:cytochrome c5